MEYIKTVCAKSGYHLCLISVDVGKNSVNIYIVCSRIRYAKFHGVINGVIVMKLAVLTYALLPAVRLLRVF
jgi:hypothetical protein